MPDEVAQALAELRRRVVEGIRTEQRIDAAAFLRTLAHSLEQSPQSLTQSDAEKVHAALYRWLAKVTAPRRDPAQLTSASVQAVGSILQRLTGAFQVPRASPKSRGGKGWAAAEKRRRTFVQGATHTLLAFARVSDNPRAWMSVLRYVDVAIDRDGEQTGLDVTALTEEQSCLLADGLLAAFTLLLTEGDSSGVTPSLAILRRHPPLMASVIEGLRSLYSTAAAILPASSQRWLDEALALSHEDAHIDYGQVADRPEIRQAAGLLLFLWDGRATTPQLTEALDRFRKLAESHFGLFMRGESTVGLAMRYDVRLHEIESGGSENPEPAATVQLLRPWIEYFRPPDASVVIRGLARPADSSGS